MLGVISLEEVGGLNVALMVQGDLDSQSRSRLTGSQTDLIFGEDMRQHRNVAATQAASLGTR